jgi:ADP-heptose:LPS heptosyltransferase
VSSALKRVRRKVRERLFRLFLRACLAAFRVEEAFRPRERAPGKRVLFVVFGGLGDCLLFDTLFRRVKEQWPGARVDVVTGCFEDMWQRLESVDHLVYFGRRSRRFPWHFASLFRCLYRARYDVAVEGLAMVPANGVFPAVPGLLLEATAAPVRIGRRPRRGPPPEGRRPPGFVGREGAEPASGPPPAYLTGVLEVPAPEKRANHEVAYVAAAMGIRFERRKGEPFLAPDPAADAAARRRIREEWAPGAGPVVGLQVEATYPLKTWQAERFVEVVERGIKAGLRFVVVGLFEERSAVLRERFPAASLLDLSGRTTLGEMISVIRQCDAFLSADTGPAHVAQACGVPTVVLFGPSNEREFGPADRDLHALVLPDGELPCRPCVLGPCIMDETCMNRIGPDRVLAELLRVLGRGAVPVPPRPPVPGPRGVLTV